MIGKGRFIANVVDQARLFQGCSDRFGPDKFELQMRQRQARRYEYAEMSLGPHADQPHRAVGKLHRCLEDAH